MALNKYVLPIGVLPLTRLIVVIQGFRQEKQTENYIGSDWRVNYTANEFHVNLERLTDVQKARLL